MKKDSQGVFIFNSRVGENVDEVWFLFRKKMMGVHFPLGKNGGIVTILFCKLFLHQVKLY